jgi:hypothetical protein
VDANPCSCRCWWPVRVDSPAIVFAVAAIAVFALGLPRMWARGGAAAPGRPDAPAVLRAPRAGSAWLRRRAH